ncbi:MAG: flavodoxin family protein [Promethearchaeota archaeon]
MSKFVVYISKSGNTKFIAEKIADIADCKLLPLSKPDGKAVDEKHLISIIKKCKNAELVFVGTPVILKQPHSKIAKFVNTVDAKRMAFFVTYENDMGFTLKELKDSAEIRSIRVLGSIEYGGLKSEAVSQMSGSDKDDMVKKAEKLAQECLQAIK